MFTGLIEDLGAIEAIRKSAKDWEISVRTAFPMESIGEGDSIAVNGACLTVTSYGGGVFTVMASKESIDRTTFKGLAVGSKVNLERAMSASGRLHGHLVQGHVDAVGKVVSMQPSGRSIEFWFEVPADQGRYLVPKGSVAIEGVSLTVNGIEDRGSVTRFSINLIPHSQDLTTLANLAPGSEVNVETDIIGRYVERLLGKAPTHGQGGLDENFLRKKGFA